MADPKKAYVGEIGKRIKVRVGISLANSSTRTLFVEKPDGSIAVEWSALTFGPDEDGWVYYDTAVGDLSIKGIYRLYCKVVYTNGKTYFGTRTTFTVYNPSEG